MDPHLGLRFIRQGAGQHKSQQRGFRLDFGSAFHRNVRVAVNPRVYKPYLFDRLAADPGHKVLTTEGCGEVERNLRIPSK